jgi:hypothetical protein
MNKVLTATLALPILYIACAVLLFGAGFVSHIVWGNNNPVEQITEEVLKDDYGVDVEFSKKQCALKK